MRNIAFCATAAAALTCLSCRHDDNGIYPVSGTVTYRGAPAAGAAVFFHRRGTDVLKEHMVMGIVQNDGSFELVCGPLGKGAPPGEYDVAVEWRSVVGQWNGSPQRGPDKLNGRYVDPQHPLLHATVQARPNALAPIELTD